MGWYAGFQLGFPYIFYELYFILTVFFWSGGLYFAKYFDQRFEQEIKKYESDNLRRYKRLERIADKAEKEKQFAAAINAEYRSGQLAGAYVDKKEITVSGLEGMSREQLEKKLEELSNKIDGHNAKTIEVESEDITAIEES